MIDAITGETTSLLVRLALNAATARHTALASNIANANIEGYRPLRVEFDERVALFRDELLASGNDPGARRLIETLQASTNVSQAPPSSAERVRLDTEVARMAQNALHYQALLTASAKLKSILRMAITGGR